jgi:hypothetical protein
LQGNVSFKKEIESSFPTLCKFKFLALERKKPLKTSANFSGAFIFSSFIKREGVCSVACIFPVSCFIIFHVDSFYHQI